MGGRGRRIPSHYEFSANLVYIVSSRADRAIQGDTVSKIGKGRRKGALEGWETGREGRSQREGKNGGKGKREGKQRRVWGKLIVFSII